MIFARLGDKKQTRRQSMAEIVFSWWVSEIKCVILKENNDNPYEIHNNYIELSIVFHPMIIRAMSTLPFQGGVIFRTFVPDSGFRTYAMLTAMVILP